MQTNLSKTEIAEKLGVNRKTIYQWSVDGDWEVLRTSARCMPSILAQKVYHLIGHFTDHILQRDVAYQTITKDEVNMLGKLVNMVTKLKAGSTASENMETFTLLLEGLKVKDPFLAEEMQPHFESFVTSKATMAHNSYLLDGYQQDAGKPFPEKDLLEKWQDEKDYDAIVAENKVCHPEHSEGTKEPVEGYPEHSEETKVHSEETKKPAEKTVDKNSPVYTKFTNSYKTWMKQTSPGKHHTPNPTKDKPMYVRPKEQKAA